MKSKFGYLSSIFFLVNQIETDFCLSYFQIIIFYLIRKDVSLFEQIVKKKNVKRIILFFIEV